MIDINKKYRTRNGCNVRILCIDAKIDGYPVVALIEEYDGNERSTLHTEDGCYYRSGEEGEYDLIEVSPYEDFKIDDKVLVRDSEDGEWMRRYFSHVDEYGNPHTFQDGRTSWSYGEHTISWKYCKKFEE